jgi:protein transport protein SEC13
VRDVAWAPNLGLPTQIIATCSEVRPLWRWPGHGADAVSRQDHTVMVWTREEGGSSWAGKALPPFGAVVWRVRCALTPSFVRGTESVLCGSWSVTGSVLAVSTGDNMVSLWKESLDGDWRRISSMSEGGAVTLEAAPASS